MGVRLAVGRLQVAGRVLPRGLSSNLVM
jgi:hypothetical protein